MPTASAAYMRSSGGSYATTYGTSFNTSSTVSRSSSATRRKVASGGYSLLSSSGSSYRPLPSGPGPIDSNGRKLESYSVRPVDTTTARRPRLSPIASGTQSVRTGPVRADHNSGLISNTSRYASPSTDVYLSSTTLHRRNSKTLSPVDAITSTNKLSGRRSASLANLHIDDEPSGSLMGSKTSSPYAGDLDGAIRQRNNRRSSQTDYDTQKSIRPGHSMGMGEDKKDGILRAPKYTPSMSRDSSPSTSNGMGSRSRQYGDTSEDSSQSSSKSSLYHNTLGSFSQTSKLRDGGKVGLCNLGNTCFMNSVLQCLSNTRPLLEWCLNEEYQTEINTTTSSMKGALVKAFANLMKSVWKEGSTVGYVSPTAFKTQIQKFAPRFVGYAQQDSQEFLRYLLEGIHEDVNQVTVKPKPITLDDNRLEGKSDHEKAKEHWQAYIARDKSHIVDIFVGQLKSELKFTECGHRSVTFDPFWDLSLPIPKHQSEVTLDDCLRLFMREEELAAEERPICTKCKVKRSCTKSFSIHRFPQILVIHLKRFSQERYGRKLSTMVEFPVKDLLMAEYASEGAQKVTYDLYGVSEHSGGVHSGHYTATCKNPYSGEWFHFNDTRVSSARSNEAVTSEAYLLFYELTSPMSKL